MQADWIARAIAISGTVVALASLGWNVISWRRQGPVIKVRATCTGRGDSMTISGSLRNTGRFDAQIVSADLIWPSFQSQPTSLTGWRTIKVAVPPDRIGGVSLPAHLAAQSGAEFTVTAVAGIDPGLSVALHDRRQVTLAFRTATGRRAKRGVRYK